MNISLVARENNIVEKKFKCKSQSLVVGLLKSY